MSPFCVRPCVKKGDIAMIASAGKTKAIIQAGLSCLLHGKIGEYVHCFTIGIQG